VIPSGETAGAGTTVTPAGTATGTGTVYAPAGRAPATCDAASTAPVTVTTLQPARLDPCGIPGLPFAARKARFHTGANPPDGPTPRLLSTQARRPLDRPTTIARPTVQPHHASPVQSCSSAPPAGRSHGRRRPGRGCRGPGRRYRGPRAEGRHDRPRSPLGTRPRSSTTLVSPNTGPRCPSAIVGITTRSNLAGASQPPGRAVCREYSLRGRRTHVRFRPSSPRTGETATRQAAMRRGVPAEHCTT